MTMPTTPEGPQARLGIGSAQRACPSASPLLTSAAAEDGPGFGGARLLGSVIPRMRAETQAGASVRVARSRTCAGPGDRPAATAVDAAGVNVMQSVATSGVERLGVGFLVELLDHGGDPDHFCTFLLCSTNRPDGWSELSAGVGVLNGLPSIPWSLERCKRVPSRGWRWWRTGPAHNGGRPAGSVWVCLLRQHSRLTAMVRGAVGVGVLGVGSRAGVTPAPRAWGLGLWGIALLGFTNEALTPR